MDPFSALAIASSVVQFVDYGSKLLHIFMKLCKCDGALPENVDLESSTQELKKLSQRLAATSRNAATTVSDSDHDRAVQRLAESSKETADKLLDLLESLKVHKTYNKLQSLQQALKTMRKKDKIESLQRKLETLHKQINTHLLALMKYLLCTCVGEFANRDPSDQQSRILVTLRDLDEGSKRMEITSTRKLDQLRLELLDTLRQSPRALNNSNNDFITLSTQLSSIAQEGEKVTREHRILDSLRFETMRDRYRLIHHATPTTFEWIFRHPDFSEWLESRSGTYWIGGKAGSGKSTLMKFLCDHPLTRKLLENWAGSDDLLVANYFFWASGSPIQRSQQGLLQSLLYQVLRRHTVLIPEVCPARLLQVDDVDNDLSSYPWTIQELFEAFSQLAMQKLLNTKLCFLIDGLDEYEGTKSDLIELVQKLATSSRVKICVSSRPWDVFTATLGEMANRTLYLHKFTEDDIKRHAEVTLEANSRYRELKEKDNSYKDFIQEIVAKAEGVFLWVYLVVNSFLEGLDKRLERNDEIADLRRRLRDLPGDLDKYFRRIFDGIDHVYREETAQIFLISVQAVQPLSVMAFSFLDKEKKNSDYALDAEICAFSESEIQSTYERMRKRLNAQCKDLLEVNEYDEEGERTFLRYKVDFLHRTVKDFLEGQEMQDLLKGRASVTFDARVSLCKIFLAQIKALPPRAVHSALNSLFALVDELMFYAGEVEYHNKEPQVALLDELDRVVSIYASDVDFHWTNTRDPPDGLYDENESKTFLAQAIQARLRLYVEEKLNSEPRLLRQKKGRPLLDYALRPKVVSPVQLPLQRTNIDAEIVKYLLSKGANPNQQVYHLDSRTVWNLFLLECHDAFSRQNADQGSEANKVPEVAKILIQNGADPDLRCEVAKTSSLSHTARYKRSVADTKVQILGVSEILRGTMPTRKYEPIEALLEEKRQSWSQSLRRMVGWGWG
jgi:NACHT domain/N-terminal domain on NACHT_NTPase and P-loop NTPases